MSEKKTTPTLPEVVRNRCPVCDKAVYSYTGIHPQCAMSRESAVLRAAQKAVEDAAAEAAPPKPAVQQPWLKTCPSCQRQVAARRFACDCGHSFPNSARQ